MCSVYYGDEFKDCLKQVRAVYQDLDLSWIIINNTIPQTPEGDDTISDEIDDSVHTVNQEAKDTAEASVQPAPKGPEAPGSCGPVCCGPVGYGWPIYYRPNY